MLTDDMIIKVPLDSRVHGGVGRAPPHPQTVLSATGAFGGSCVGVASKEPLAEA